VDIESVELPPEAEARLQTLMAEQRERRSVEELAKRARRRLWLTHHWHNEYDRCTIIHGRHVCRRCLVLYPLGLAVAVAALAGLQPWPQGADPWFIWMLCIPATLDFLAEKLFDVGYSAKRQVVVTALVAVGFGRGLAYEIDDRWSWLFWGPVLVYGGVWFAAAVYRVQQNMMQAALESSIESGDMATPTVE